MKSFDDSLWWCRNCRVPLLKKVCENCGEEGFKICSDLKPMFKEECEFLEGEIGRPLPGKSWQDGLWMRYKTIWFNGHRLMRLSPNGKPDVIKEYQGITNHQNYYRSTPEILYQANRSSLDKLEDEAITFILKVIKEHSKRVPFVSFSGGKDSTAVSYLVRKAMQSDKVLHIFGDTTIEYPDTYDYIKRFEDGNGKIPFLRNSNSSSFLEMCELIGPPSRINAWCCSVFKASPIANIVNNINGGEGVISFEGIRRKESSRRGNRQRIYNNKKIVHQLSVYPIIEWKEAEVWLFILAKGIKFNLAYLRGFHRVGCMYCPNNVPYNEYLLKTYYPQEIQEWIGFLTSYAKKIDKVDPSEYVNSGAWKMRVGKSEGKSLAYVKKVPCLKNINAMHFILDKKITDDFKDRFRPFGKIKDFSDSIGEGFVVKDSFTSEELFMIKMVKDIEVLKKESSIDSNWELGEEFLCVDLLTLKNTYRLLQDIERQIRKFQACIGCGVCAGVCPTNAISINPHFKILEDKCSYCKRCISSKYIKSGCVSLNSQQQSKEFFNVNRS